LEEGGVLADLRALVYRSIQTLVSSGAPQFGECSNVFTAEPGTCEVRKKQRDEVGFGALGSSSWCCLFVVVVVVAVAVGSERCFALKGAIESHAT
jgi:hypothetical protein